jgi:hypothetical protein
MEQVPSLRELARESTGLSEFTVGFATWAGMPDDAEPAEGAPRTKAPALFLCGDAVSVRDRQALLHTFDAYGGDKRLWMLHGTRQPPHAFATHDGEYQRQISEFLRLALAGEPNGVAASANIAARARDGETWYEITLAAKGTGAPRAVEACAVLADGTAHYARTWLEQAKGRVRLKLPSSPIATSAIGFADAEIDAEHTFRLPSTPRSRSAAAVDPLWQRIEALRNDALPETEHGQLAADLAAAEAQEPFDPRLAAELADTFAKLGRTLRRSVDPALRKEGSRLLQRAIDSAPARPDLHFWPGTPPTYGFQGQEAVAEARRLLAVPAE